MAGAWGVPTTGAWANQVDAEEEANGGQLEAPSVAAVPFGQDRAFPTLGEAVKKKDSRKDKKKPQKMNLSDFQTSYKPPSQNRRPGASDDQILSALPTAPRTRDDDAPASAGMGGAFRDYGGRDRGDGDKGRERGGFGSRRGGFGGGSDDGSEGGFGGMGDEPSRADAVDDWGASRKFVPSGAGGGGAGGREGRSFGSGGFGSRREGEREGGEGGRDLSADAGPSRADTAADWGAERQFKPSTSGGGGFEDRDRERGRGGGGFGSGRRGEDDFPGADAGPSRADTESRWGSKSFVPSAPSERSSGGGGFEDRGRDREGDTWGRRTPPDGGSDSSRGSTPAPSSRPRLKLAPRTKPPPVLDIPPEARAEAERKASAPSEPSEQEPLPAGPPKPRANPFGAARPREEVLKEQGRDWKAEEVALEKARAAAAGPPSDTWGARRAAATEGEQQQDEVQKGLEKLSATDAPEGQSEPTTHMNGGEEPVSVQDTAGDKVEQEEEGAAGKKQLPEEPAVDGVEAQEPATEAAE